jgi:predicted HTH domain antitoxin
MSQSVNLTKAAEMLEITRPTLLKLLKADKIKRAKRKGSGSNTRWSIGLPIEFKLDKWISGAQAAEILDLSRMRVYELRLAKRFRTQQQGKLILLNHFDVLKFKLEKGDKLSKLEKENLKALGGEV